MTGEALGFCSVLLHHSVLFLNTNDLFFRSGTQLLVPTAGGLLLPASRVVHVGTAGGGPAAATAARLLGRADPQQLVLAHPQLTDHICRWLGVRSLSELLSEELDPAVPMTTIQSIGSVTLRQLQQLLSSPHFASSVFSIVAEYSVAVPGLRQVSMRAISDVCEAAASGKLLLVERLTSRVVLKSSGRDVTRDTASRQVCVAGGGQRVCLCQVLLMAYIHAYIHTYMIHT
jgi:hypothetical protein